MAVLGVSMGNAPLYLGPWSPLWHTGLEWLAYFVAWRVYHAQTSVDVISPQQRIWVFVGCVVGAAFGSKVVVWLDHPTWFWDQLTTQPWMLLLQGKGIGGALVGGLIGVEAIKKILGITPRTGDRYVFPLLAAIIIGRLGCFLTGYYDETYGMATTLPWAVDFGDGMGRHPTQLYEMVWAACLMALLWWRTRTHIFPPPVNGRLFQWFMVGYFAFRLGVEFIKPVPHAYGVLNGTQLLSLAVLAYYLPVWGAALLGLVRPTRPPQNLRNLTP